ncbi:hypothetical protein EX30DRAFT_293663, partial [Ascodesmis nigricans]
KGSLTRSSLRSDNDPLSQFEDWFQAAKQAREKAPETTIFTTVRMPEGRPSSRIVYLKEKNDRNGGVAEKDDVLASGFVIYSNWGTSQKSADLKTNPLVGLTFWGASMERQVHIQGRAVKLTLGEGEGTSNSAQKYYSTRLLGSRIGACASRQSTPIDNDRKMLDEWVHQTEERFENRDEDIPCPPYWGGVGL